MTEEEDESAPLEAAERSYTMKKFFEQAPPRQVYAVTEAYTDKSYNNNAYFYMNAPTLRLFCEEDTCHGFRFFTGQFRHHKYVTDGNLYEDFVSYECNDCGNGKKVYCISFMLRQDLCAQIVKIGEYPENLIETPARLEKLLGNYFVLFAKGLRCERQGFGIASFAYYRRVVEAQKDQLIEEILKVAKLVEMPEEAIKTIEKAREQGKFANSVDLIKDAVPQSLLTKGHNPLKLIHKALSSGLHEQSDQTCLELANTIRLVLVDLAERLDSALKEKNELESAVARLHKFNSKQQPSS